MDPQQRLLLELAFEAHQVPRQMPSATAVVIGAGYNDFARAVDFGPEFGSLVDPNVYTGAGGYLGVLSGRISFMLDLHGPCMNIDTSCSSGIMAVHVARREEFALCGAAFLTLLPFGHAQLARAGMLSPKGRCYTFDSRADGFAKGEALGMLRMEAAHGPGDIRNSAARQDGRSASLTAPNGTAQVDLLHTLAANSARHEAHGTGTLLGDPIEVAALARHGGRKSLSSVKANAGHAEPCAGLTGLLAAANGKVCFHHRLIHYQLKGNPRTVSRCSRQQEPESHGKVNTHLLHASTPKDDGSAARI